MFKDLGVFFKSKGFLVNLLIAIIIVVLFFSAAVIYLSKYTRHGEYIILPNLANTKIASAETLLNSLELKYVIIDSVYTEDTPPGLIINQNPYPGAHVKRGRNIYLYITSTLPPLVEMPDLLDKSLRQAKNLLDNNGLKAGTVKMVSNPLSGFVLKQTYKGLPIEPGSKIPKGSLINMEVGEGNNNDSIR
jgi:eukaryotic-like serine/threonine-protein kinase